MIQKSILENIAAQASKSLDPSPSVALHGCTYEDRYYLCGLCKKYGLNISWEENGNITTFNIEKRR